MKKLYEIMKENQCYATAAFVALNVFIFLLMAMEYFGLFFDIEMMVDKGAMVSGYHQYHRILIAMFLHFDIFHLLGNMIVLVLLGSIIESYVGSIFFAIVYMVGGLVGNIYSAWNYQNSKIPVVAAGASGAVFAVMGMFLVLIVVDSHRVRFDRNMIRVIISAVWMVRNIFIPQRGVDNYGHLGGLVTGVVLTLFWWILVDRPRQRF